MTYAIAIVGSGPSGFYAAESIAKNHPEVRVDILEKLPTPYGLVRYGVAPDHQGTKNVWRVYQRTAKRPNVRFLGNVELGKDITLEELRSCYDAVVLAIGAPVDKDLGIAGENLPGVIGSHALTSWYNGHPDHSALIPHLGTGHIAVVGNGNVAVDIVRVLARAAEEMLKTDLPDYARDHIHGAPITDIHMLGRRSPLEASFTPVELRELGEMSRCVAVVDGSHLPETISATDPGQQKLKEKIVDILRGYSKNDPSSKPLRLHIHFFAAPSEVLGTTHAEGLKIDRTRVEDGKAVKTGESFVIPATLVVKAIGYGVRALPGLEHLKLGSSYPNVDGKIEDGLWAVGWAKRGPSGVIATNRQDSIEVTERLMKSLPSEAKGDPSKVDAILRDRKVHVVTWDDWEKIEAHEHELAENGAPRKKVTHREKMLELAKLERVLAAEKDAAKNEE